jgi:predicted nuclease with TOPRIM domain
MATKEKDSNQLTKTTPSEEKELNEETIKAQLKESVEYHNKLVPEKERLLGEVNKVDDAIKQNMGKINTLQGLQNEFFVNDAPSDNGAA